MQTNGTREITTLQTNGTREMGTLQTNATREATTAQTNIVRELTTANTQGSQQLQQLQTSGTQSMTAAGDQWNAPVRTASSSIQSHLNDMLYGMAQVIQQASLPLAQPAQFQVRVTGNEAGGLYSHADGGLIGFHGGSASPNEADMGSLLALMKAGQVAMDDGAGGISRSYEQSQLHWWGEGNADEAFIPKDGQVDRMLPILKEAASWYNAQVVPDEGTAGTDGRAGRPSAADLWGPKGMGYVSGRGEDWSQPHHDVEPYIRERADQIAAATGTAWNTYVGHGTQGGSWETVTVDFWDGYQGSQSMTYEQGMAVADMVLSQYASDLMYMIAQGSMYRGGWFEFPEDPHYDHTHVSWGGAGGEYGGGGGGWRPHIPDLVAENFPAEADFGPAIYEQSATEMARMARQEMLRILQGTRQRGVTGAPGVDSTDPMTLIASYFPEDAQGMAETVMMRESGGDPAAYNPSGASGLFQIMPSTAEGYGFDSSQLFDPKYNAMVAGQIYSQEGWGPWGETAYTNGGIAQGPQMAMVGENGPEMFIPLHDPQATTRFMDFVEEAANTRTQRFREEDSGPARRRHRDGRRGLLGRNLDDDRDEDEDEDEGRPGRPRRRRRQGRDQSGPGEDRERAELRRINDALRDHGNHFREIRRTNQAQHEVGRRMAEDQRRATRDTEDVRRHSQETSRYASTLPRQNDHIESMGRSMQANTTDTRAMRGSMDTNTAATRQTAESQRISQRFNEDTARNTSSQVPIDRGIEQNTQAMVPPTNQTANAANQMVQPTATTAQNTGTMVPNTAQCASNTGAMVQPTSQTAQNTSTMAPAVQQTAQSTQSTAGSAVAIAGSATAIAGSGQATASSTAAALPAIQQTAANTGQMVNTMQAMNTQNIQNGGSTTGTTLSQNTGMTQGGGTIRMRNTMPGQRSSTGGDDDDDDDDRRDTQFQRSTMASQRETNRHLNSIARSSGGTSNYTRQIDQTSRQQNVQMRGMNNEARRTNGGIQTLSRQNTQQNSHLATSVQVQRSGNQLSTNINRSGGQTAQNTMRGAQASQEMVAPTKSGSQAQQAQSAPITQTANSTGQMVSPTSQTAQSTGQMVQPTSQTANSTGQMVSPTSQTANNTGTMVGPTQQTATAAQATAGQCTAIAGSTAAALAPATQTAQNTAEMVGALDALGNQIAAAPTSTDGSGGTTTTTTGSGQTSVRSIRNTSVTNYRNVQNTGKTQGGGRINMPQYATGGLVTAPHMGIVGEAGPELILPLTDRSVMTRFLAIVRDLDREGNDVAERDAQRFSQHSREILSSITERERRRGSNGVHEDTQSDPQLRNLLAAMVDQNQQLIDLLGSTGIKLDGETKDDMYERNKKAIPEGIRTSRGRRAISSVRETDSLVANAAGRQL